MNLIRKNIVWLLASQLATWVASLALLLVVPNKLGSSDFGDLAFAGGYVQFFVLAASLGTSLFLSRAIARDHALMGSYIWNAVLLKLAVWAVMAPAAFGIAYALGNRGQTLMLIAIGCLGMLPYLLNEVFFGALAGIQVIARPALWAVVNVYFVAVFGIGVILAGGGVVAYALVPAMGALIPMTATAVMVRPFVRGNRTLDRHIWWLLVVGGVPLLALTYLNFLYGSLDVPILHAIAGSEPVGWYGLAYRWIGIPFFVTTAVCAAYFPSFSMHGNPQSHEFAPLVNRAIHIVLFVTVPAAVGLIFTADTFVHLLYDQEFDPAIALIQILAVGVPVIALDTVLATALIAANRLKGYLGVAAIAACLNPVLAAIAIKVTDTRYDNGAIGAAIVTVVTELWIMAGALHFKSPGVLDRVEAGRVLRIVAAAAAMVPALALSSSWPLPLQVLVGIAVYAAASFALGSITIAELRENFRQTVQARRSDESSAEPDGRTLDQVAEASVVMSPFTDPESQP